MQKICPKNLNVYTLNIGNHNFRFKFSDIYNAFQAKK